MSRHIRAMLLALQHRQDMIERLEEAIDTGLTPADVDTAAEECARTALLVLVTWQRAHTRKRELAVRQREHEHPPEGEEESSG